VAINKQDMKVKKIKHPPHFFGYILEPKRETWRFSKNILLKFGD
jgi:hypothetical protein